MRNAGGTNACNKSRHPRISFTHIRWSVPATLKVKFCYIDITNRTASFPQLRFLVHIIVTAKLPLPGGRCLFPWLACFPQPSCVCPDRPRSITKSSTARYSPGCGCYVGMVSVQRMVRDRYYILRCLAGRITWRPSNEVPRPHLIYKIKTSTQYSTKIY